MINEIENWIDQTNQNHSNEKQPCSIFEEKFDGFYTKKFLENSYFVLVDEIPKPDFQELRDAGFSNFIDMPAIGITYKDTYYINKDYELGLRLHFHELVHVAQWKILGAGNFIQRYMNEIVTYGYDDSPLEIMAYGLDEHFTNNGSTLDVPSHVSNNI